MRDPSSIAPREKTTAQELNDLRNLKRQIQQAGPAMELLTGQPQWDQFLQLLQVTREEVVADLDDWRVQFEKSVDFSHARLMELKVGFAIAHNKLAMLDYVMGLPKQLMENAKRV